MGKERGREGGDRGISRGFTSGRSIEFISITLLMRPPSGTVVKLPDWCTPAATWLAKPARRN